MINRHRATMVADYTEFEKRKQDHIQLALMDSNQATACNTFDTLTLRHDALPDLNFDELSIASMRFNRMTQTPFMVASMTAGHADAIRINQHLIAACHEQAWAMGVGSQRRELTDAAAAFEWASLRRDFSNVPLFSNLGIAQLIATPISDIQRLVDALEAEALLVHCNPLQEVIQPEGTPAFKGCWDALAQVVKQVPIPLVVKETGCGFSKQTLSRLNDIGVAAVDVSGLGGTHWGRIEGHRATNHPERNRASQTFRNWGIDTLTSVCDAASLKPAYEIWGSGGVRHGLDAAKLIACGASMVGFAKPLLEAALQSTEAVISVMTSIEYELKVALFCTGSRVLSELREKVCR